MSLAMTEVPLTWASSEMNDGGKTNNNNKAFVDLLIWNEEDNYFGNNHSGHMPSSPDTVCFDKSVQDAQESLLPEAGIFNFDHDIFLDKNSGGFADFDALRFLDPLLPVDKKEAIILTSFVSMETSKQQQEQPEKPTKKRAAPKSTISSSSSDEEGEDPKPKKSKASPKYPRSRMPTSAYRGVSRCTKDGRWQARIRVCKEVVYLGRYPTEEQAARRYDEAARLHHGTAAMLNFVTQEDLEMGRKSVFSSEKSAADHDE